MSASPPTSQPAKRKRKSQRVVDSDEEYEQEVHSKVDAESSPKEISSSKPIKSKAITRGKKKPTKTLIKATMDEDGTDGGNATPSVSMEATSTDGLKDSDLERPTKRPRLPNMRKSVVNSISNTPAGSNTPLIEKSVPLAPTALSTVAVPQRQIVDGPVTKDIDLRDGDVFSQLFKKSGTGKTEARYDMTSSEKMEHKKVELAQLREQYIARKAQTKGTPFDLGAQNRKLADVQHTLEQRGSRVCVNVVGSCILTIDRDWIKLAADKEENITS